MRSLPLYVLDTGILVYLIRQNALGQHVELTYGLSGQPLRPLVCIVTHGELLSLARQRNWAEAKRRRLTELLENLVTVDISRPDVLTAYAELDVASQRHSDGARNMGKNDLWIAAVARVVDGTLLTTDRDFDHLHLKLIKREYVDPELFRPAKRD